MDDFKTRFQAAKTERQIHQEGRGREVYKFCFNGREREWDDTGKKTSDPEEIFTDRAAVIAEEFHGELFSTMTPENAPWVEFEAGNGIPEENVAEAEQMIAAYEKTVAKAIKASNYYTEGQTVFQDAVVGTCGMWVDKPFCPSPPFARLCRFRSFTSVSARSVWLTVSAGRSSTPAT